MCYCTCLLFRYVILHVLSRLEWFTARAQLRIELSRTFFSPDIGKEGITFATAGCLKLSRALHRAAHVYVMLFAVCH